MRARLLLLGGQTIALGLMMAFLVVPVSARFLNEYGASALPYAYIAVAVAGVAVSSLMSQAQRRISLARLTALLLWIYLVAVVVGWIVLTRAGGVWVTFPLLVMFPLSIPLGFVLVGSQAGRLLDVRQMKAHFPRVAAGFSVGFALGGITAAALVRPLGGPDDLLALDGLAALTMLGLAFETARRFPDELRKPPTPEPKRPKRAARGANDPVGWWRALTSNRLVLLIFGYQVLSAAVTQLLDFMVWERAAARYPDASDLAQFQGIFGAVINVASVAFVVSLGGWLLTRYGLGLGLAANPLGVLVLLAATTVVGYAVGPVAFLFFALVCAQQVTDISLTDGTTRTSINATYQALQPDLRLRAQTMIEGAGVPLALGFVGVLLLGYDALGLDIRAVVIVTFLLTVVWVAAAVLAYREYGVNLRAVISRRAWDPVALRIDDEPSRDAVRHLLASTDARDVHAALDALVDAGHRDVSDELVGLLQDPNPERRKVGIEVATAHGVLAEPAVAEAVRMLLADPDPEVGLAAAAALVRLDVARREVGRFAWLEAIDSDDPDRRHVALRAAAALPHSFFVPFLIGGDWAADDSGDLLSALLAHADLLAPRVEGLLADPTVPARTRERVVVALGQADSPAARDLLLAHLDDGDPAIFEAAGRSLLALGHQETPERLELGPRMVSLAERANRCLQVLALLDEGPGSEPLRAALLDVLALIARRAEVLLDLVHDPRAIAPAISGLATEVERDRSTALEMLEVTVGRSVGRVALALVDPGVDASTRQRLVHRHAPVADRPLEQWLRELVLDRDGYWGDPWLRACALYAVPGRLPQRESALLAAAMRADESVDVAEAARWVAASTRVEADADETVPAPAPVDDQISGAAGRSSSVSTKWLK